MGRPLEVNFSNVSVQDVAVMVLIDFVDKQFFYDITDTMKTLKNFFAICFATVTFIFGIGIPVLAVFVIQTQFDFFSLLLLLVVIILFSFCLLVAKYSQRVQVALESSLLFLP